MPRTPFFRSNLIPASCKIVVFSTHFASFPFGLGVLGGQNPSGLWNLGYARLCRDPPSTSFFCLCAGTTPSFHTSLKTVLEQSEKSWEKSFHADSRLQGHINNPATGCQRTNFNHQFRVRPCRKRNATRESVAQDTALQYKTSVFAARRSHALKKKEMSENPLTVRHFSAGRPVDSLDH